MIFPFRNLRDVLGLHAKVSSRKIGLIFYDAQQKRYEMSYLELVGKSHQVANFLFEDLGINRGDTIAIASPNNPNALLLYLAMWVIGASVVALDIASDDAATKFALQDSEARILFVADNQLERYAVIAESIESVEGIIQIGGNQRDDYLRFEDLAANRPTTFLGDESGAKGADIPMTGGNERTARLSDLALIRYQNSIIIHQTQGDLLENANRLAQSTALTGNQTFLAIEPIHNNFVAAIITPLLVGATIVLSEIFSADLFWQLVVGENAHISTLNSESLAILVKQAQNHVTSGRMRFGGKIIQQDVKHFRHILTTDTTLSQQTAYDFEDTFGIPLISAYQHPKTGEFLTLLPITLAWTYHQQCLHGYDTPSFGVPLRELAIIDEAGNPLSEKQVGKIAICDENGDYQVTGDIGYFLKDENNNHFYFLGNGY